MTYISPVKLRLSLAISTTTITKIYLYICRPKHKAKPEMYLWEKMHLVDHFGPWGLIQGLRRRRWFQMYKVSHLGR